MGPSEATAPCVVGTADLPMEGEGTADEGLGGGC